MGKAQGLYYDCIPQSILEEGGLDNVLYGILGEQLPNISDKEIIFKLVASSTLESGVCVGAVDASFSFQGTFVWVILTVIIIWVFHYIFKELIIRLRNK